MKVILRYRVIGQIYLWQGNARYTILMLKEKM